MVFLKELLCGCSCSLCRSLQHRHNRHILSLKEKWLHHSLIEILLATSFQVANHLLVKLSTVDIIVVEIFFNVEPSNTFPMNLVIELGLRSVRNVQLYGEYSFKQIYIKGLLQSIEQIRGSYSTSYKAACFQKLAHHATSLTRLQATTRAREQPHKHTTSSLNPNNHRSSRLQETINNIASSSTKVLRRSYSKRWV